MLRIEDTDRERSTPENVSTIFDALEWLGIDWDEGPIYQSANADRHAEVVQQLLDAGHAYRSTAGPDEVRAFKEAHGNRGFRGAEEGEGAVRLRVPDEGATVVHDAIRGETAFENALLDDLVIARGDGTPIYHLAVVVDDADAGITHVVRGADHYSNTPKQMLIQQAIGAPTPVYGHLPLLHGPDGKKLSKRHGATSVQDLRDAGYLPEAVLNYVALLGWGYDDETTFHTIRELQERFRLERVSKNPAVFDEQKLRWMNGRYVRELDLDELTARLEAVTGRSGLRDAVAISQDKISTLAEFWPLAAVLLRRPGRRSGGPRAGARGSGRPRGAGGRPGRARGRPRALDRGVRAGRARRRGRAARRQAQARLPAAPRGSRRDDRLTRYLRDDRAAGARRDPDSGGPCAQREEGRLNRRDGGAGGSTIRPVMPIEGEGRDDPGTPLSESPAVTPDDRLMPPSAPAARPPRAPAPGAPAGRSREPYSVVGRSRNEGHGKRLTAAFEALEVFPALAESRNRAARARLRGATLDRRARARDRVRRRARDLRAARGQRTRRRRAAARSSRSSRSVEVLSPEAVQRLAANAETFEFFERGKTWDAAPERFRLHAVAVQRAADRLAARLVVRRTATACSSRRCSTTSASSS